MKFVGKVHIVGPGGIYKLRRLDRDLAGLGWIGIFDQGEES